MLVSGLSRDARTLSLGLLFTVLLGLSASSQAKPLNPISEPEFKRRLDLLQHTPWSGKAIERNDGWFSGCRKITVTLTVGDPSSMATRTHDVLVIRPDTDRPVPVAMVVPTMDGVTAVERTVASKLCAMNVAAIITDVNQNTVPDVIPSWGFEDTNNRRAILTLRTVLDYIEGSFYFDSKKIGMIGSSLGGFTTAYMAGVEPKRINAFVIVVGGGNLPYTLSVSDNNRLTELRGLRMASENFASASEYEDKLRETILFDPMHFSRRVMSAKIFMALSRADTSVPSSVQQDLFEAFGKPEHTIFNVGHVSTVIGMAYFYFDYISNFLSKRFGVPALKENRRDYPPVFQAGVLPAPLF